MVLVTPSHHRVHHSLEARHIDRNFGGVLIVWDRLFGTFAPEGPAILHGFDLRASMRTPPRRSASPPASGAGCCRAAPPGRLVPREPAPAASSRLPAQGAAFRAARAFPSDEVVGGTSLK